MHAALALLAVIALALVSACALALAPTSMSPAELPGTKMASNQEASSRIDPPAGGVATMHEGAPSVLPAAPVLKRSSHGMRSMVLVVVLVLAGTLAPRRRSRPEWACPGYSKALLARLDGASRRGPPSRSLPALGA